MIRGLVLAALGLAVMVAEATPRYRRPKPAPPCERVLVSEDLQEEVAAIARTVAEWLGEARNLNLLREEPVISGLSQLVAETRASFTVSKEVTEARLTILRAAFEQRRSEIEHAISVAKFGPPAAAEPPPADAPRPELPGENSYPGFGFGRQWPPNSNDKP